MRAIILQASFVWYLAVAAIEQNPQGAARDQNLLQQGIGIDNGNNRVEGRRRRRWWRPRRRRRRRAGNYRANSNANTDDRRRAPTPAPSPPTPAPGAGGSSKGTMIKHPNGYKLAVEWCWGASSNHLPLPKFLRDKLSKRQLTMSFYVCWGAGYGTVATLLGSIPGIHITGAIMWSYPIFGKNRECIFCNKNSPSGKINICKDITFKEKCIRLIPVITCTIELKGNVRICLSAGLEKQPSGNKMDLSLGASGGISFSAELFGRGISGDGLANGLFKFKNVELMDKLPVLKWHGTSIQLSVSGSLWLDGFKFMTLSASLDETGTLYGLKTVDYALPSGNDCTPFSYNPSGRCASVHARCASHANHRCMSGMCGYHKHWGLSAWHRRRRKDLWKKPWQCCLRWGYWQHGTWCY